MLKLSCGLISQCCEVLTHPGPEERVLHVLQSFPSGDFAPAPFIAGSRGLTEAICERMISQFAEDDPNLAQEWAGGVDTAPQSDDAQEYVAENPESLRVHFCNIYIRILVYLRTMWLVVNEDGEVTVETSETEVVCKLLL